MSELRVLCRVITYDPTTDSILLVRNKGQQWWCAPGGGWDFAQETLEECAKREVFEEAGLSVSIEKPLFTQTLLIKKTESVWLEQFWFARPDGSVDIPVDHIDEHGVVDEARWFTRSDLQDVTAYPLVVKDVLWDSYIPQATNHPSTHIGHFVL